MDTYTRSDLVDELASDDRVTRADAMRQLRIGSDEEIVPYLAGCLMEHHTPVAATARRVLAALGDDSAVFVLMDLLTDENVSWSAAQAIGEFDDDRPLVRHVQALLKSTHCGIYDPRLNAARALGELGDRRAVPALVHALHDPERNVREEVIHALGSLGDDRAVGPLSRMLAHAWAERNRFHSVWALARMNTDTSWMGLIDNLHLLDHSRVYTEALRVLVEARQRRAIPKLLKMMESGVSDYALTGRALRLLGHTGLAEEMLELLKHPHCWERQIAVETLAGFGDERAVEPVIEALADDDCEVRASAVRALGHLGDTKAVQPLVDVLDDPEHWVAAEAVHSLEYLGDVRAVPHLTPLLEHDSGSIRVAARQALKRLRGSPGTVYDPFGHLNRAGAGNPTTQIGRPADGGDSL